MLLVFAPTARAIMSPTISEVRCEAARAVPLNACTFSSADVEAEGDSAGRGDALPEGDFGVPGFVCEM